jgi:hypothetical protein
MSKTKAHETDIEMIVCGLQMRMCFIETGNPLFRAKDICNIPKESLKQYSPTPKMKALSQSQMKLILRSEEIIKVLYKNA